MYKVQHRVILIFACITLATGVYNLNSTQNLYVRFRAIMTRLGIGTSFRRYLQASWNIWRLCVVPGVEVQSTRREREVSV